MSLRISTSSNDAARYFSKEAGSTPPTLTVTCGLLAALAGTARAQDPPADPNVEVYDYEQGSELRDPSMKEVADYFARLGSWYTQGGFKALVSPVYDFLNTTPDRVPMTDWYETTDAHKAGFQARSVVGGVFIKLLSDPDDGTILGGAMVGLRASEVITTVALAVHAKLSVQNV